MNWKTLGINVQYLMIELKTPRGKHCFICKVEDGKAWKVFDFFPIDKRDPLDIRWGSKEGDPTLFEATKIQNICAMHGLAPRVYDVQRVRFFNKFFAMQIVEYTEGEFAKDQKEVDEVVDKVVKLGHEYGFELFTTALRCPDVKGGQLIDFNDFRFTEDHEAKIRRAYIEQGKYGKVYYQNIPNMGLNGGPRDSMIRAKKSLLLNEFEFEGKSVVDFGCAGGFFARYCMKRGAETALGVDCRGHGTPDPIKVARLISNEMDMWNVDFEEHDIREWTPKRKWDVTLFLSMNYHVGIPSWLADCTNELCIFEDNSKKRDAKKTLEKMFTKVVYKGDALDHSPDKPKQIYWCYK